MIIGSFEFELIYGFQVPKAQVGIREWKGCGEASSRA